MCISRDICKTQKDKLLCLILDSLSKTYLLTERAYDPNLFLAEKEINMLFPLATKPVPPKKGKLNDFDGYKKK
uniref:Uncharacterized protein n=1 Tax=Solanum tuberosum TaxID=4113 RepID=M1B507_SOLTU